MHEFDGDTRKYNALMDYVAFKELDELISNSVALEAHSDSYEIVGDVSAFSQVQQNQIRASKINALKDTLSHFGSQTIVSLCTTFEVSVRDYLRSLFLIKPEAMFDFLGTEDLRGYIPLKEVLHTSSHEELLANLSHTASGRASKGKYGQVYTRAMSFVGITGCKVLADKLNALQKTRNKFIHERHRPIVEIEQVHQTQLIIDEAIEELCRAAVNAGIPGKFSCVNPQIQVMIESIVLNARKNYD